MYQRKALKYLINWSERKARKPLVLRGARQVGKTTLINIFSKRYKNYIYLNLERKHDLEIFENNHQIEEVIKVISLRKNIPINGSKILLFIDEIQNSKNAVSLMRYFYEEYPNLHFIAAGSLLEIMVGHKQISFPVGRVEFLHILPVSFSEYLNAAGKDELLKVYNQIPVPDYAHEQLLSTFNEFTMLGGMPEIVRTWLAKEDIIALNRVYLSLQTSYLDDVSKYARTPTMVSVIRHAIKMAPYESGKRITFAGFGKSNYRSREVGEALRELEKAMIIDLIYPTTEWKLPLLPNYKKKPRLQFLDTGIINYTVGLQTEFIGIDDISKIYKGKIVEHIVGQELRVTLNDIGQKPMFWVRDKKQSQAEVDFIFHYRGKIIPVETKSGKVGRLRSLQVLMEKSDLKFAIRFYADKFNIQNVQLPSGKKYKLLNIPYYEAGNILEYIEKYI